MSDWRRTAKLIITTFLVTSAAWLIGGAILLQRWRAEIEPAGAAAPSEASDRTGSEADDDPRLAPSLVPPSAPGQLTIPVAGVTPDELIDTFTQAREGGARIHDAIDILAPQGTPIYAAAPGTVEKLFVSDRGGNTVYVRSPDRTLIYYYAHLDAYARGLREGAGIRQGDAIGTVGATGNASPTAPHLHLAIMRIHPEAKWWEPAVGINPYPLLGGR
ncbi:MAG: M23 family metallopeptidase [Novosphingobium sp.]|nr:M23 family metallopeptidase [Novosphingobium sp.]